MPDELNGRIDFWNIGYPLGAFVYLTALVAVLAIVWGLYQRSKYWNLGAPNPDAGRFDRRSLYFLQWLFIEAFGHKRLAKHEPAAGAMHVLIFWGMFILFIATVISAFEFNFERYIGRTLITERWSSQLELVWDLGGLALLIGLAIAVHRRYIKRVSRLDTVLANGVLLALIALMAFSGFLLQALRQAATELEPTSFLYNPSLAYWSPASYVLAKIVRATGLSIFGIEAFHFALWWAHAALMSLTFMYAAWRFGPLMHIFTGPLAIFWRSKLYRPKGALRPMGELMELESFGASDITHLTKKQLLDLDACTNCGRCQDQCPAWASGKSLSPRKLVQDAKLYMSQRAPSLLNNSLDQQPSNFTLQEAVGVDALWACTTCGACVEACPVGVEHIDSIIDMRRFITMEEAAAPETAMVAMTSMEQRGHPWRGTQMSRTDWMEGMDVITMAQDPDHEVLLWVGCTPALDPRAQKVARAMASVLKVAGVKYRVLGNEETCTGDPARRMGNEYLFELLAKTNIDTFNRYGIQHIVTMCPHCFNSILNEYPQLGGKFKVEHYTQFVGRLVRNEKIKPVHALDVSVAYHDSCYLARHNDLVDEPREIAKSIPGLKLIEIDGNSRERGFCCGAGGGRMFMEEKGKRVNHIRTEQFLETGADAVGVSCPFCLQMMEEGISAKGQQDNHFAEDIVELLAESVFGKENKIG